MKLYCLFLKIISIDSVCLCSKNFSLNSAGEKFFFVARIPYPFLKNGSLSSVGSISDSRMYVNSKGIGYRLLFGKNMPPKQLPVSVKSLFL